MIFRPAIGDQGLYSITVTVTDGSATDSTSFELKVEPYIPPSQPPVADFTYKQLSGLTIQFNGSASYDPDNPVSGEGIVAWDWYRRNAFGQFIYLGSGEIFEYTFASSGRKTIRLTVTDDDGQKASIDKEVIVNRPKKASQSR
jgi:PKD repeat protein